MNKKILKNLVGLSAMGIFALQLSACHTEVVVAPNHHCEMQPHEVCHDFRDYYGHFHHECRIEYVRHCWDVAETLGAPVGPVGLGNDFGISYDAADRFIDVAVDAKKGNLLSAQNLGLNEDDLVQINQFKLPSDKSIDTIAKTLGSHPDETKAMFQQIIKETQANLKH